MSSNDLETEWRVEWATPKPNGDDYLVTLVLTREQAIEYGDKLVESLRVNSSILRERELDPKEPFAWKIENGELLTKQISRQMFEQIAEGDREDSFYARKVLKYRARR